jgi:heme/copper-type cytochrome/quinol oxidase subunit 3
MNAQLSLDVSHLPPYEISHKSPLWWGQLLLAVIEGSMFFILLAMYFYLRLSVDIWPPPGTQIPHLLWPTIALILLIASAAGSYIASEGAKKDNFGAMIGGLILNLGLAAASMVFRGIELNTLNFNWRTDIHGTIFWAIIYLHTLDAVADLIFTLVLIIILASGKYGDKQRLAVHVDSLLWYFIVLIWIPAYVIIYWGPRFAGAS